MGKTTIGWTDYSWPLVNGCRRVGDDCTSCYAERLIATRLSHLPKYEGLATYTGSGPRWTVQTRLWEPDLAMPQRIKRPSKIFVVDMGDLFYEGVSDDDIMRVLDAAAAVPRHTYQFLTKRPERMAAFFATCWQQPIPGNWWLGISAGHHAYFTERWPCLAQIPAAVRWVSYEPAIGPIDVSATAVQPSWVVCGCDNASGRPGRPMDLAWARALLAQCQALGVPVFIKQLVVHGQVCTELTQFPADLQVQEFPGS